MRRRVAVAAVSILGSLGCGGIAATTSPDGTGTHVTTRIHPSETEACGFAAVGNSAQVVPLACDQLFPLALTVDSQSVYWITQGSVGGEGGARGEILKVPKAGGPVTTLASGRNPVALTVDSANVYWTETSGDIVELPLQGGEPLTLAMSSGSPERIATDSRHVYWCDLYGSLMASPVGGGIPQALAQCDGPDVAVGDGTIYWTLGSACDADVMSLHISGGVPTKLAAHQGPNLDGFAASPKGLYWADSWAESISLSPSHGAVLMSPPNGKPVTIAASGMPVGLAVSETSVYWTGSESTSGSVLMRTSVAGGAATTVASGNFSAPVAADTDAAYMFASTPRLGVRALVHVTPSTP